MDGKRRIGKGRISDDRRNFNLFLEGFMHAWTDALMTNRWHRWEVVG